MARIRTIKPDFFVDSKIAKRKPIERLFFIGLWTHADKNGVLEEDQERLKIQILPYDKISVNSILESLAPDFIVRYESAGKRCIWIKNFQKHQRPHPKETSSNLPLPVSDDSGEISREIKLQAVKKNCLPCKNPHSPWMGREGVFDMGRSLGKEKLLLEGKGTGEGKGRTAKAVLLHPQKTNTTTTATTVESVKPERFAALKAKVAQLKGRRNKNENA